MYQDRSEAGLNLADELLKYDFESVCVIGVPRGGVVVAEPIARQFKTKLDLLVTRKIGHPLNQELAIGAVMPDGSAVLDSKRIQLYEVPQDYVNEKIAEQSAEIRRRMVLYTGTESLPIVEDKTVIVVDDGIATGYTIKAAVKWLKTRNPLKIVLAVPVGPPETLEELAKEVDKVICPLRPPNFMSVGAFYHDFSQISDDEVIEILEDINYYRPG